MKTNRISIGAACFLITSAHVPTIKAEHYQCWYNKDCKTVCSAGTVGTCIRPANNPAGYCVCVEEHTPDDRETLQKLLDGIY